MDINRIRAETPALERQTFLLSAGASLMPDPVVDAMVEHLRLEQAIGGYGAADREHARIDSVYATVAELVNADRDEIALVESATVGWQRAFYALDWQPGDRILTGRAEYAANYVAFLQMSRRRGVVVEVIPSDAFGATDPEALRAMIDERVKLIAITWVPTNGGLTNPAAAIGRIARQAGVLYLLDACQAVGQMPVDVKAIQCDILVASGRKFLRGPRGTGFLYIRRELALGLEPAMIDHFAAPWTATSDYTLRPDARRFETWEANYVDRIGLGAACRYALAIGLDEIAMRCRTLAERLRVGLSGLKGIALHDLGADKSAIVSFTIEGRSVHEVLDGAAKAKIVIGASAPASTRLDSDARGLPDLLRASPHYFNLEAEVDRLIDFCASMGRQQRGACDPR
jgi:cysteine desulfurase / selenocysteine lyase